MLKRGIPFFAVLTLLLIPGLAAAGTQVWRLDDFSQQPVAGGQLSFSAPYLIDGVEVLDYTQIRAELLEEPEADDPGRGN